MRTALHCIGLWLVCMGSVSAEELDLTHCYSGEVTTFSQSPMLLLSFRQNGILMSNHPNKLLHGAVVHCEGIQRGGGPSRKGDSLCKIVDQDGDAIAAEIPYEGFEFEVKFVDGTGKWKGVTGSLRSTAIVRSQDGKGAMPGTWQVCRSERGRFEVSN